VSAAGLLAAVAMLAPGVTHYDCVLEAPVAVSIDADGARANEIGIPPSALSFSLTISDTDKALDATIDWAGDPFQMAGKSPALRVAPGAISWVQAAGGPCMFSESACLGMMQFVAQPDGTGRILFQPAALARNDSTGVRTPFVVVAQGRCTKKAPS
jgi:hypothetical protein